MAFMFLSLTNTIHLSLSLLATFYLLIFCSFSGRGEDWESGGVGGGAGGGSYDDPPEIVAKALLCFNDKYIYSACEETYRLKESGDLEVAAEKTDEYCSGPCLEETNLVLDCIDGIFSNFLFMNRATLHDIRETIQAGCGYGPQRGNFNVLEHIKAELGKAYRASNQIGLVLSFVILGLFYLLF